MAFGRVVLLLLAACAAGCAGAITNETIHNRIYPLAACRDYDAAGRSYPVNTHYPVIRRVCA